MKRQSRPVRSREYKVMLKTERFDGKSKEIAKAAERFRKSLKRGIAELVLPIAGDVLTGDEFAISAPDKQVVVEFRDTKDRRLRESNLVFRTRQPVGGGSLELTLKCRHPDRFLVSDATTGGKLKFEEDIKISDVADFISLHSLSGKIKKVAGDTKFRKLKDVQHFFRPLKDQLGDNYKGRAPLRRVGAFTAAQTVLEGPQFKVGKKLFAECALIIWHPKRKTAKKPAVVEFSFRYHDREIGAKAEPFTGDIAIRCTQILNRFKDSGSPLAKWADPKSPTKTAFVYGLK